MQGDVGDGLREVSVCKNWHKQHEQRSEHAMTHTKDAQLHSLLRPEERGMEVKVGQISHSQVTVGCFGWCNPSATQEQQAVWIHGSATHVVVEPQEAGVAGLEHVVQRSGLQAQAQCKHLQQLEGHPGHLTDVALIHLPASTGTVVKRICHPVRHVCQLFSTLIPLC